MQKYVKSIFYTMFILTCKNVSGGCPQSLPLEEHDSSSLPPTVKRRDIPVEFQKETVLEKMKEIKNKDPQRLTLSDKCIVDIAASYGDPTAQHILNTYYSPSKGSTTPIYRTSTRPLVEKQRFGILKH